MSTTTSSKMTVASLTERVDALFQTILQMTDMLEAQNARIESQERHIAGLQIAVLQLAEAQHATPTRNGATIGEPIPAGRAAHHGPRPYKLMNARFRGHCAGCGKQFASGHTIAYGEKRAWHPACSPISLHELRDERRIVRQPVGEYEDRRLARLS